MGAEAVKGTALPDIDLDAAFRGFRERSSKEQQVRKKSES